MIRRGYWRMRTIAGIAASSENEVMYRLLRRRNSSTTRVQNCFAFPWGKLEFTNIGNVCSQYRDIFVRKEYAFESDVSSPMILDCGGNIGMSAIWFKQRYPKSSVVVYEADPLLSSLMAKNVSAAGCGDVLVHNKAVWTSDGMVGFDSTGNDSGHISTNGSIFIPSIDLASHIPERVDLLKMDIEGAEFAVIDRLCGHGAINRIRRMVVEFHVRRAEFGSFMSTMNNLLQSGMHLFAGRAAGSYALGKAASLSSFDVVGDRENLFTVYAWR